MGRISLDKSKMKILLVESIHPSAAEAFRADGYDWIETHKGALAGAELEHALADTFFLGIRSTTKIPEAALRHAPKLTAIGCFCIGTNQVDLNAAQARGVPVFNAPFSNTRSVAELVVAQVVLLMRGIPRRNAMAHRGEWDKSATGSYEVRGKRLGIVGYGHIGTQVGLLAEAMGMRVSYFDVESKLAFGNASPAPSLEKLLSSCDVVTLHVPETPQTKGMIGKEQLAQMKAGAHLVNASRGTVVDIEALASHLRSGHLAGAAIDVFPAEPKSANEEFVSPLRGLDQVILTPHVGGSTMEAQQNIGLEVATKLLRYSNNGSTLSAVNFPEVSLPAHPGEQRLLHIHRNQPGVLTELNAVFSELGINVTGQYLQTNPKIGYVVMDVHMEDRKQSLHLKKRLSAVSGTIRTRILF